jgi:glucan phosphoethanolaminetransferase (alkaline phosphatase superfamily)
MAEIVKETTTTTQADNTNPATTAPPQEKATGSQSIEYVIYFLFGVLEILLAFRFVLKLLGASVSSSFVNLIYGLSGVFTFPFEGIFRMWFGQGSETTSVFEPSTLVAIIVYAIIAWGIVMLIRIFSGEKQQTD